MIPRYTRAEMARLWSDEHRFAKWLEVELAATDTLAAAGIVPAAAAEVLRARARIDVGRIHEVEARVKHDVIAFTVVVGESVGDVEAARWLHYGLTSNDVVDTAQSLVLRDASAQIEAGLTAFGGVLRDRAFEFKDTPQIGRTHGIHAEPITFGLKLALWYDELQRNLHRFQEAALEMRVGKISGVVGTFGHVGPEAEERICRRLHLEPAPIASQVISRDRHAYYVSALALISATLAKIALEIRHLQRTEVREAEEPFSAGQKGSSAMPHKRNPVTCEQICGLARVIRSNVQSAFEDVALWHERDISHSSVERIVLPDSTILVDYMLHKIDWLISGLRVHRHNMLKNLELTRGLVFSGQLLLDLAAAGMLREDAYCLVQRHAMEAWETGGDFRRAVEADPEIARCLGPEKIAESFSIIRQLSNVDQIFDRVFHKS